MQLRLTMLLRSLIKFPACATIKRHLSLNVDKTKLGVIGVPFGRGQPDSAVDLAPKALREEGRLISVLTEQTNLVEVKDYGDVTYEPISSKTMSGNLKNLKNIDHVAGLCKVLSDKVFEVLQDGQKCLILGGDHSFAAGKFLGYVLLILLSNESFSGSIDGHLRYDPDAVVFYIDAHADISKVCLSRCIRQ